MTDSPVVLITGGGSGIGAAAARELLDLGHRVAITGRNADRLASHADSLPGNDNLLTLVGDTTDWDGVRAAVDDTVARFGRLDVVVANAGSGTLDSVVDGDPTRWREMVLTNVLGPALLIRAAVAELRKTRGRIVLVGSVVGFVNTPGDLYGATKWALTGLAENTRRAVTEDGIGVTLVAPGRVDTPFWPADRPEGHYLGAAETASTIVWAIGQPAGVDVNTIVVRPVGQRL
ncbi:SDR family oxidoreductase [Actinokineospora enzanensis]|uniref:SDR family oxidoreductase n=1 Tax=Actinokineospora enzanensis TaxID=155975 RepID=UPI00036BC37F|nr:SDR family NAD(P)-dependent oxidoreductase [Actinokineospora enzanensis]